MFQTSNASASKYRSRLKKTPFHLRTAIFADVSRFNCSTGRMNCQSFLRLMVSRMRISSERRTTAFCEKKTSENCLGTWRNLFHANVMFYVSPLHLILKYLSDKLALALTPDENSSSRSSLVIEWFFSSKQVRESTNFSSIISAGSRLASSIGNWINDETKMERWARKKTCL